MIDIFRTQHLFASLFHARRTVPCYLPGGGRSDIMPAGLLGLSSFSLLGFVSALSSYIYHLHLENLDRILNQNVRPAPPGTVLQGAGLTASTAVRGA